MTVSSCSSFILFFSDIKCNILPPFLLEEVLIASSVSSTSFSFLLSFIYFEINIFKTFMQFVDIFIFIILSILILVLFRNLSSI